MSDYTGRLKLRFDPFDITAEPSGFYQGGDRQVLLDQLIQLSSYSSDIAVVTGPLGSGKSTLSHIFAQSLDDDFIVVCVQASLFMGHLQLLEAIGTGLDLEVASLASEAEIGNAIANFAGFMADKSKTVQVIIDDAHELSDDALSALLNLVERQADTAVLGEGGIKVVLLGEAQLFNTLDQLPPITATRFEFEPLNSEEAAEYIQYKLATAGFSGNLPFDFSTVDAINEQSNGTPGAISTLVRDELGHIELGSSATPVLHFAERHLIAASLVFAAALLGLFFLTGGDQDVSPENTLATTETSTGNRIQIPLDINAAVQDQQAAVAQSTLEAEPLEPAAELVFEPVIEEVVSTPELTENTNQIETDATDLSGDRLVASASSVVASEIEGSQVVLPTDVAGKSPVEHPLLAIPSSNFTLQLLGSRSETNVRNFISDHGGGEDYAYFETQFREKPWYVVVYGNYSDSITAKAAIADLPGSLNELEPWARSVAEIQQAIRTNQ